MIDALRLCNVCDAFPMAPGQEEPGKPGYCSGCLADEFWSVQMKALGMLLPMISPELKVGIGTNGEPRIEGLKNVDEVHATLALHALELVRGSERLGTLTDFFARLTDIVEQ